MVKLGEFTSAFTTPNREDLSDFIDITFHGLKREAKKTMLKAGSYSISIIINDITDGEAKAQEIKLEEVA